MIPKMYDQEFEPKQPDNDDLISKLINHIQQLQRRVEILEKEKRRHDTEIRKIFNRLN